MRNLATVANPPKLPFDATCSSVTPPYEKLVSNLKTVKRVLDNEPLTLAEKILYSHLTNAEDSLAAGKGNIRGQSYLKLNPDRVAMQGSCVWGNSESRCQCPNGNIAIHG
jgi:homoaconitase